MKRKIALLLVVVMTLSILAACVSTGGDEGGDQKDEDGEKLKIALLTDVAGTQVFVLSMIEGLEESAEKHGFEAIVAESADAAAFEDNARGLVEEGVDFIIGGGWPTKDAMERIAEEYPDAAKYALIDDEAEAENIKSISYREQEGAYLIGLIAGLVTDEADNIFGSVHANEGAGSWKWRYGYMEGVKRIKPDAKFIFNYVGDFNDPAKAKEFAIQQYEQGAKFVNASAAGGDKGVFEAALEKGFYTSGQDVDLTTPDNEYVVSSQIKDTYATVMYLIDQFFEEEWSTENETWGAEEGTIGAVHVTHESENPVTDRLSEDDLKFLKEVAEDIKSRKLDFRNMPKEEDY